MKKCITLSTPESLTNTAKALHLPFETNGFEFVLVNSLIETIRRNGADVCRECQTFAIGRPEQALISLYREDGKTIFCNINPTAPFSLAAPRQQQLEAKDIDEMIQEVLYYFSLESTVEVRSSRQAGLGVNTP